MYTLCVSGAVNTQGFVWKFFYALYIHFHSLIPGLRWGKRETAHNATLSPPE